ncbi:hypothetical protein GCM10011591_39040 [Nocardia camponoti]|uniref:Uncharacterized protein n=1 Tax=Nocardia camponoti TaxID=1616106 RepID=A0A917VD66_9NOCA|nr:hypothetical protein GCM10011591_39040 [Nocardia camponoti]
MRFEYIPKPQAWQDDIFSLYVKRGSSEVSLTVRVNNSFKIENLLPDLESDIEVLAHFYGVAWPVQGRAEIVIEDLRHPPSRGGYYHSSPTEFKRTPGSRIVRLGHGSISAIDEKSGLRIEISDASELINVLHSSRPRSIEDFVREHPSPSQTLKISGICVRDIGEFERFVSEVALSFSFDLEARNGIGFKIGRPPKFGASVQEAVRKFREDSVDEPLSMTMNCYDPDAASYYHHARRSESVPIAAFLGYYQVLEYFFRRFAMRSSIDVLRRTLKNPAFDVWSDDQLVKMLTALSDELPDRTAERNQLKAVLTHAVDADALKEFLDSVPGLTEHLRRKDRLPGVAIIASRAVGQELLDQIADRVHQIRCQIVHSRGESRQGETLRLLPDSPAAALVGEDVRIIRYLAMSVICASADRLNLR